jgi:hypothetical protein
MGEPKEPSGAARLHIIVKRDEGPDDRRNDEAWGGNPVLGWLRWLIPATAEALVTVPGAEAGRLLRMVERAAAGITWSATVIGTLFGASAAHLPPIGTTIVVVLEIVVPPTAMLRARRGDDKDDDH